MYMLFEINSSRQSGARHPVIQSALGNTFIQQMIAARRLRQGHIEQAGPDKYPNLRALMNPGVQTIVVPEITANGVFNLSEAACLACMDAGVQELLRLRLISVAKVCSLRAEQSYRLRQKGMQAVIKANILSIDQALAKPEFNTEVDLALQNVFILEAIRSKKVGLTFDRFLQLPVHVVRLLKNAFIQSKIDKDIEMSKILRLNVHASTVLLNKGIQSLIVKGWVSIDKIIGLREHTQRVLLNTAVQKLIISSALTIDQLGKFSPEAVKILLTEKILRWIEERKLITGALEFVRSESASFALMESKYVSTWVEQGRITSDHVAKMNSFEACAAVFIPSVFELVEKRKLSIMDVFSLPESILNRLADASDGLAQKWLAGQVKLSQLSANGGLADFFHSTKRDSSYGNGEEENNAKRQRVAR